MQKINSITDLREAILELESRQAEEEKIMRGQFNLTYESLKPLNLIKSTFKEAALSVDLKDNIVNSTVGLVAGFLSKKIFEGVSRNPLKKLLGTALMFGITNIVTKNPETVKKAGKKIFEIIRPEHNGSSNGTERLK